jgi:hypothetical protein
LRRGATAVDAHVETGVAATEYGLLLFLFGFRFHLRLLSAAPLAILVLPLEQLAPLTHDRLYFVYGEALFDQRLHDELEHVLMLRRILRYVAYILGHVYEVLGDGFDGLRIHHLQLA